MLTIFSYFLFALGSLLFSFVLWKKLRDDYTNSQIYSFTLFSVLASLLGLWVANTWLPEFAFLITFLSFVLSSFLLLKYLQIKFFEFIDAVSIASLYFYFLLRVGILLQQIEAEGFDLKNISFQVDVAEIILVLISAYLYKFFLKRYRQFSWYPSGKIGFAGLATVALFFLFQVPVQVYSHTTQPQLLFGLPHVLLTSQLVRAVLSFTIFIIFIFVIYFRSGRRK